MKRILSVVLLAIMISSSQAATMDAKSKVIADASVEAIGGRQNYDNTRYLSWLFFDRRFHVWDKYTGDVRIEYGPDSVVLMNVNTKTGRVWESGIEITEEKALKEKLQWGYETWINDSYWVVMPFKLHDDGVNLTYAREDVSLEGKPVDVLTMTFDGVGVTPENKYEVFFDKQSKMFSEFAFYKTANDKEPAFRLPWKNWQQFGKIMLSDNRGESGMAPLQVHQSLPETTMTSIAAAKDDSGQPISGALVK